MKISPLLKVVLITIFSLFLNLNVLTANSISTRLNYQSYQPSNKDTSANKYANLYNFLIRQRYPYSMLGSLKEFTEKVKIKEHAKMLYEGLRKDGYSEAILGTEDQFIKKYAK